MSDEFKTSGAGFQRGAICTETSLYKTYDGQVECIQLIAAGTPFPNNMSGAGTGNVTWFKLTLATDGDRISFNAVRSSAVKG